LKDEELIHIRVSEVTLPEGSVDPNNANIFIKAKVVDYSKYGKFKSNFIKGTLKPLFDESFTFSNVTYKEGKDKILRFQVLHKKHFEEQVLGELEINLSNVDESYTNLNWYPLSPKKSILLLFLFFFSNKSPSTILFLLATKDKKKLGSKGSGYDSSRSGYDSSRSGYDSSRSGNESIKSRNESSDESTKSGVESGNEEKSKKIKKKSKTKAKSLRSLKQAHQRITYISFFFLSFVFLLVF